MILMVMHGSMVAFLERTRVSLAQSMRACVLGIQLALIIIAVQKYSLLAIMAHFVDLNFCFNQLKLDKVKFLLISSTVAWLLCLFYYQFKILDVEYKKRKSLDLFFGSTQ